MSRNPSWTAISAPLVMLVAVFVLQASPADADDCLAAPKGAAPSGQHWYYHFDRATKRKCWYLHETIAKPATNAAAPTARSNSSARPAAPTAETNRSAERAASSPPPRDASAQPIGASSVESNASHSDEATGSVVAPGATNTKTAPPLQPASEPTAAQGAATPWSASPPPASAGVQDASGTPNDSPPAGVANPTDAGDTTMEDALAQSDRTPMTAAAPENPSTHSVAQDLLIIALAAVLAGAVSVIIAVIRRRKSVTTKLAGFIELAAGLIDAAFAKFAALRRTKRAKARPAAFTPNIGSRHDRQSDWRPRPQTRKDGAPQAMPLQTALVPEQLTMARPLVAPRQQARVNRTRPARVE